MSCSRVSPSYSLVFFAPLAVRASLGSVFVVAIRFLGPGSIRFPAAVLGFHAAAGTCWIVNGNWGLEKHGSFQFRRLRSDHVTNVTADGDANHSPALGGCFTVLSASALSLALPVERAHSNLAVPPTAVAGTASVFGRTFGALRIRPYTTLAGKARRYSRIWFSRLSGRLEFGRRRRTCSALPEVAPLKVK